VLGLLVNGLTRNDPQWDTTFPGTCASGRVCAHYTQIVWAATTAVGCGYAYCPSQAYPHQWRCVYGEGGNHWGVSVYDQASSSAELGLCSTAQVPTPMPSTAAPSTSSPTNKPEARRRPPTFAPVRHVSAPAKHG
jgi:hypothetical protein